MSTYYEMGQAAADQNRPRAVDLDADFVAALRDCEDAQEYRAAAQEFYQGYDELIFALVETALNKAKAAKQPPVSNEQE